MTDTELLIYAAKAVGLEHVTPSMVEWGQWNPLEDDGDALRLAVALQLTVCNEHESGGVAYCTKSDSNDIFGEVSSGQPGDPPGVTANDYAATRRAIVRAAAAIGKAMP